MLTNLAYGSTYSWRVMVHDETLDSDYNSARSFTTEEENLPPTIALNSPENNASLDQYDINGNHLIFKWDSSDPENGTTNLNWDFYFGESGSTLTLIQDNIQNTAEYALEKSNLTDGTTYQWKVTASDGEHEVTSETWSFSYSLTDGGIYNGNVLLPTQTDVDNFVINNYSEITGYLIIGSSVQQATDLNGFTNLRKIGGILNISYTNLSSLNGLANVNTISGNEFVISYNPNITNLTALENITSLNGSITIKNNATLTQLTGLHNITSTGNYLQIESNNQLTNLVGIGSIETIGGTLSILFNNSLNSIDDLKTLLLQVKYKYVVMLT